MRRSRSTPRLHLRGSLTRTSSIRSAATAAGSGCIPSTGCRHRLLHGIARPWPLDRRGRGPGGATGRLGSAGVRAGERRRVQRGLAVGGGRCSPPITGSPTWSRSSTRTASRRSGHTRECWTWRRWPTRWRGLRLGRPTRSTATTRTAARRPRRPATPTHGPRARHRPHRRSARVSRSWRARSSGTTGRCPTRNTRRRSREIEAAWVRAAFIESWRAGGRATRASCCSPGIWATP